MQKMTKKRDYHFTLPMKVTVKVRTSSKEDAWDNLYDERFEEIFYDEILFEEAEDINDY